jgi:hypothetical protein
MEIMVSGGAGYSERLNNLQRVSRSKRKNNTGFYFDNGNAYTKMIIHFLN